MAYQQITYSTLKSQALARLGNSTFWSATEVGLHLNEAIRVWNLITHQWKGSQNINTVQDQIFYTPSSLISASVTDQNILNEIQYHCLETPNNGASMTSDLWTIAEWINLMNNRTREFLAKTRLKISRNTQATSIGVKSYNLNNFSQNLIEVWRAAWLDADGNSYGLGPGDEFQFDQLYETWPSVNDQPALYAVAALQQSHYIDIVPAPSAAGTLDLSYTELGTALSNTGVVLPQPNDFSLYTKWGTLADMFSKDGQAPDALRAAYCHSRFQEGIALAEDWMKNRPMRTQFGTTILDKATIFELDDGVPQWQADSDSPQSWFPFGAFQIGVHPADSVGSNTLTVQGLKNAPVLSADGDYLDLGQWEIAALLDYTEHIALFKVGGEKFKQSLGLLENFLAAAAYRNKRLDLKAQFRTWMGSDV